METATIKVGDGTEMQIHIARPTAAPTAGIIVIQEAFGVTDYIRRMTERFAKQGYLAVAPEMFHRSAPAGTELSYTDYASVAPHMQAMTLDGQIADLKAAYDCLVEQGIAKNKIAALGFCMGGRAAFLANATLPLAAAVSFYGGGIADTLLDRAKDLSGPQMLLWGGLDAHIPKEKTDAVAAALRAAGKPFIEKTFPDADHAFARDPGTTTAQTRSATGQGVGDHYNEAAATEAWKMADAFLAENLE